MSHPRCTLVLLAVLALAGAWYAARPGSPNLNAAQAAKQDEKKAEPSMPSNRSFELAEMLEKTIDFPGVDAPETKLGEELERMQKVYKLTFDLNEKAFKAETGEGILDTKIAQPTFVPPMRADIRTVLRRIFSRVTCKSGVTYLIRKDCIEITTERAARIELGLPPAKEGEQLPLLVTADFSKQHLQSVLDRISNLSGRTVALDPRTQNKGETAITVRLLNVPVETAVELVAEMAGLAVVRRPNVFFVTTKETSAAMQNGVARPAFRLSLTGGLVGRSGGIEGVGRAKSHPPKP
jgi:hypothetical protein